VTVGATASSAAPAVAVVVKILEDAFAIDERRQELDLAPVIHLAIFGRGRAVHDVAELKVVQVIIGPAHNDLNDIVQAFERHARRHLDPAPDRRIFA
jgi:hypothetical protein